MNAPIVFRQFYTLTAEDNTRQSQISILSFDLYREASDRSQSCLSLVDFFVRGSVFGFILFGVFVFMFLIKECLHPSCFLSQLMIILTGHSHFGIHRLYFSFKFKLSAYRIVSFLAYLSTPCPERNNFQLLCIASHRMSPNKF